MSETTWEVVEHEDRFPDDVIVAECDTKDQALQAAAEWNKRARPGLTYEIREVNAW